MNNLLAYLMVAVLGVVVWMMLEADPAEYDPADKDKTMGDE